jgi:hypothetical protein
MEIIISAIALFLLFEGTLYAIFPEKTKRMIQMILELPLNSLRIFGLVMVIIGVTILFLV